MNFAIYDRRGQLVFQTEDQRNCWDGNKDGKEAQIGVYTYRLYARQLNGLEISKAGNITWIR